MASPLMVYPRVQNTIYCAVMCLILDSGRDIDGSNPGVYEESTDLFATDRSRRTRRRRAEEEEGRRERERSPPIPWKEELTNKRENDPSLHATAH